MLLKSHHSARCFFVTDLNASDHEGKGDDWVEVSSTGWSPHVSNHGDQNLHMQVRASKLVQTRLSASLASAGPYRSDRNAVQPGLMSCMVAVTRAAVVSEQILQC